MRGRRPRHLDDGLRRRLGAHAWMDPDGAGGWRAREGRPAPGWLTEFQARRRVVAFVEAAEADVQRAKPSTLRDYRAMLADPGVPYRRGHGKTRGRWAESPDIEGWTVAGESYEDVRRLAEDGVPFALASAAEDRGEAFHEERFATLTVEHYVPAPA